MQLYNKRKKLYQWESNQQLIDENLKIDDRVCFSTVKTKKALVVKAKSNENGDITVEIPNILLQDYHPLYVHWMIYDNTGDYVYKNATFEIERRAKPEDYAYEENEVWTYIDLENRVKILEAGGASPDAINQAVEQYLKENPIQVDIPETLPNPEKIKFTGAVQAEYDGSQEVIITIPEPEMGGQQKRKTPLFLSGQNSLISRHIQRKRLARRLRNMLIMLLKILIFQKLI